MVTERHLHRHAPRKKTYMYFAVDITLAQELNLKGSDAMVYFTLVFLTKKRAWKGSSYKLAKYSRCGSAMTAGRALDRLIERGLVVKDDNGLSLPQNDAVKPQNDASLHQNEAKLKESSKENNRIKEESLPANNKPSDGRLAGFNLWWSSYAPTGDNVRRKKACSEFWMDDNLMPNDWRKLAIERAKEHEPDRNPLFWLKDGEFLKNKHTAADEPEVEKPDWLSGEEQAMCFQAGTPLASCWNPDTHKYGVVTLSQALKLGLIIKEKLLPKND